NSGCAVTAWRITDRSFPLRFLRLSDPCELGSPQDPEILIHLIEDRSRSRLAQFEAVTFGIPRLLELDLETHPRKKVLQLRACAIIGILQNAAGSGPAPNIFDGIQPRRLFKILIEVAKETRVVLHNLRLHFIEIGVRYLRLWKRQRNLFARKSNIARL